MTRKVKDEARPFWALPVYPGLCPTCKFDQEVSPEIRVPVPRQKMSPGLGAEGGEETESSGVGWLWTLGPGLSQLS